MRILIDELANPCIDSDFCLRGFTSEGNPKVTGKWAMQGNTLFVEFEFTVNSFFGSKKVCSYVREDYIKIEPSFVYFDCHEKT